MARNDGKVILTSACAVGFIGEKNGLLDRDSQMVRKCRQE
jgi:hypothetical protein